MLTIDILTLFPEYFTSLLAVSMVGRAQRDGLVSIAVHGLREFGLGKHKITDDRPFGGGAGMVLLVEPIDQALTELGYQKGTPSEYIGLTSAKGTPFTQQTAENWAKLTRLCLICGHYEGVDERVVDHLIDGEFRIGNYVLTGGEPAAAVVMDAVTRLQSGVLGNPESLQGESHAEPGVMGYPQYSRPAEYRGWNVPNVLLQGNHAEILHFREQKRQKEVLNDESASA